MGARSRLRRNESFRSNPEAYFDEYDIFDSPERPPTPIKPPKRRRYRRTEHEPHLQEPAEKEIREDTAKVMKALNNIRSDLEYLLAANVISEDHMAVISGELPQSIPVRYAEVSYLTIGSTYLMTEERLI